jgi:iron(III) transport system permease protein
MARTSVALSRFGRMHVRGARFEVGMLVMAGVVGLGAFLVIYPVALLLINSFNVASLGQPPRFAIEPWRAAFSSPAVFGTLINTFEVFLVLQAIAFPVAILIAWLLARTNLPFRYGFEFLFWISFFLPTLSIGIGWVLLLDPNLGLLKQLFFVGPSPFNVYSFWGIIWIHLMAHAISVKVMLLTPAFRLMDGALDEASQTCGAGAWQTLRRVTLPVLLPELVVVALLSTLRIFESYEIEQLAGVPFGFYVYSTRIISLTRESPPLYGQATALGSLALGLALVLLIAQRRLLGARSYATVSGKLRTSLVDLGWWKWPIFGLMIVLVGLQVVVPVVSGIVTSLMTRFGYFGLTQVWTIDHWRLALSDPTFLRALQNSVLAGLITAVLGPLLFSIVAYLIARTRLPGRGTLDTIAWLPQAIPGVLLSLALLWLLVGTPLLRPIYSTLWMLVLAFLLSQMPIAVQLMKAGFLHLSRELEEASRAAGGNWWQTYRRVVLPLLAPTMVTIAVLQFVLSVQNVSTVTLLSAGDNRTLAVLALDLAGQGLREAAAVYTTIVVLLTTGLALAARFFGPRLGVRGGHER